MRSTQCIGGLYLTVVDSLAPLPINNNNNVIVRGGVEDTRLEAKAKNTKKIQGQGQPFQGQTLSRPKTGTLEAKAKDQGHKRKCSPKKRSSQKFFRRSPQKIQALHKILTIQKLVLSSIRGQANFRGLEVSRPRT